jgi:hypothetical protein
MCVYEWVCVIVCMYVCVCVINVYTLYKINIYTHGRLNCLRFELIDLINSNCKILTKISEDLQKEINNHNIKFIYLMNMLIFE